MECTLNFELFRGKHVNIADDCAYRCIELFIPPGKCGQSQMLPKAFKKTNSIAKMIILVDQTAESI